MRHFISTRSLFHDEKNAAAFWEMVECGILQDMKRYSLETTMFLAGAAVMILELVGSRVLAPYLGTSLFVWTSLIGIVLLSLSAGYFWGGLLADRAPNRITLSLILFIAAACVGLLGLTKEVVLSAIRDITDDLRIASVLGTFILFAGPSILLGMVSPYAVKLKLRGLSSSGRTVGTLYAISTAGSIAGTFAAGFFLIPSLGTTHALFLVSGILLIAASLPHLEEQPKAVLFLLMASLPLTLSFLLLYPSFAPDVVADYDTAYNRVWITDGIDARTLRPIRKLATDAQTTQSAIFLDRDNDLVLDYTKYYRLARHFVPDMRRALLIGGGAYTYPRDFLKRFPAAEMDVVEIDPGLTDLARTYFNLQEYPRLRIFYEDGRTFLNRTRTTYNAVFIDAFKSLSPPFELTTRETVQSLYRLLDENGAVLMNVISAIQSDKGMFLRALYATYRSVFPQVYLFPVKSPKDGMRAQNIIIVALKSSAPPAFNDPDPEQNEYLAHRWTGEVPLDVPILTDERAPVEYYLSKLL